MLLCAAAGYNPAELIIYAHKPLDDEKKNVFMSYVKRRAAHEPIQYIIGKWDFMGLPFLVNRNVLIPRPETERLVECVVDGIIAKDCEEPPLILDLCTGSGCVAVSLAKFLGGALIIATDISAAALGVAAANAELNGVSDRILFLEGDLFNIFDAGWNGRLFDAICSNPPYIPKKDIDSLPADVRMYEPSIALDGGIDGMEFLLRIAAESPPLLKRGGLLAVETGYGQAEKAKDAFMLNGYADIRIAKDINGVDRVVTGRK